ncbi:hypothetical protein Scep_027365 [Stephania cephalantha]|uniref:Uncharacterized protein n=1 Tax=Stephania cephalantha TaxID=152367 RepID=A0AAP0EFD1_9MAGN
MAACARRERRWQASCVARRADPATRSAEPRIWRRRSGSGDDLEVGDAAATNNAAVVARDDDSDGVAKVRDASRAQPKRKQSSCRVNTATAVCEGAARNGFAMTIEMGLEGGGGEKCNRSKSVADQPTWTAYMAFVAILLLISNRF